MTTLAKIWLTFFINKVLGSVGPALMTYGITVSDNTAELVAGTVITAFQIWLSQRNLKNAIKADPKEKAEDKAGSLAVSILALSLIPFLSGCALLAPNYSALPKDATLEQKKAAALADTKRAAANKGAQFAGRVMMTEGGRAAVASVKDKVDRDAIKDQLKSWGGTLKAKLKKGDVTIDQARGILSTFNSKVDAEKFRDKFELITQNYNDYLEQLSSVDSVEIINQWLLIVAESSIAAGS